MGSREIRIYSSLVQARMDWERGFLRRRSSSPFPVWEGGAATEPSRGLFHRLLDFIRSVALIVNPLGSTDISIRVYFDINHYLVCVYLGFTMKIKHRAFSCQLSIGEAGWANCNRKR